jgi:hypothetical protein
MSIRSLLTSFLLFCVPARTVWSAPADTTSAGALSDLDQFFMQSFATYARDGAIHFLAAQGPVIVVEGFRYTLLSPNGHKEFFNGPVRPFDELKDVSHVGPCLFAIGQPYWRAPDAAGKRTALAGLKAIRDKLAAAAAAARKADWSNPTWPGQEEQLRARMVAALEFAGTSVDGWLGRGDFRRADYVSFAHAFTPTMTGTFRLATLADTTAKRDQLLAWKKKLGDDWKNLWVIILGSEGRFTAGLTRDTQTTGLILRSLMDATQFTNQVFVAPQAATAEQGIETLPEIVGNRELADLVFKGTPDGRLLYEGLTSPTENIANPFTSELLTRFATGTPPRADVEKWLAGAE